VVDIVVEVPRGPSSGVDIAELSFDHLPTQDVTSVSEEFELLAIFHSRCRLV